MKKKGSITVYLVLFLSVVLLLFGAVCLSVRYRGAKTMVKTGARQSVYDLFSRYEATLFQEYDLLFIDAGFQSATFRPELMLTCVQKNAGILWGENSQATNLWGLSDTQAAFCSYTLATDQGGEGFFTQAVASAKTGLVGDGLTLLKEQLQTGKKQETAGQNKCDVEAACDTYETAVEKAQEGEYEEDAKAKTETTGAKLKANPIETVKKLKKKGILGLVVPEDREISTKKVQKNTLVSGRSLEKGIGVATLAASGSTTDDLLYGRYLRQHLSSFTSPSEGSALAWQLEYVIAGKNSDKANLKKTVEELLLMREGANFLYLKKDAAKMAQVRTTAAAIAAALAVPVGEELIANVLCVCWAYGESIVDVRTLLAGGKVPLVKDKASWQLSLEELASLGTKNKTTKTGQKEGLTYQEYLEILVDLTGTSTSRKRGMDMVELGMQGREGCENFYLDHCIQSVEIELRATVKGLGEISAKEYRSYEN